MDRVKIHTTEQVPADTTAFILSCDRLEVLRKTIASLHKTKGNYPLKYVIVDDSAREGVFESLVEEYGSYCDVICFPRNRSQWWAMDFMVSYCDTDYIFYVEDDWEFTQSGYLEASKQILQKYRNIGTVDISWRTFEWQGFDSYDKNLVDSMFFYKKPWRISDYHLHWYGWVGSPNLKRRDDLILLGRVEKWHNEWNIDRRFLALGFKAVFLNGEYVRHLGDDCSKMAGKRPNDATTPEDYFPEELKKDRIYPTLDYRFLDSHWRHPYDISIVTAMVDIMRGDRNFDEHYIKSLDRLLQSRHPITIFTEEKYFDHIRSVRGDRPLTLKKLTVEDIENCHMYSRVKSIVTQEKWINQAEWIQNSVIRSPQYICLTLLKHNLMQQAAQESGSTYLYWVDAGIYNSYGLNEEFDNFYFTKLPKEQFFMTKWPYNVEVEMHGFNRAGFEILYNKVPDYVCRATIFGGSKAHIGQLHDLFYKEIERCLDAGYIGAEEAIYSAMSLKYGHLMNLYSMPNGDIKNLLFTLRAP